MKLNSTLLQLCKLKRWSLAQLSRESGVAVQTLHGWTTGRKAVRLDQLKKVSAALEVSMHQLAFGEPDPFEPIGEEVLREIFTGDVRVTLHRIERRRRTKG